MSKYILFTDSTADLSPALIEEMDVQVIPMCFTLDGAEYRNWPDGREMDMKVFYDAMRAGSAVTTSQIAMADFRAAFEPVLAEGADVLYLAFSGALSGTYQASCLTADDLMEQYPGRRVVCVDTLNACMGEGLLVYHAALLRKGGAGLDEVADWVRQNALSVCSWFTVDTLTYLKRGGRVSAATAMAGNLLGIKPVLHVDEEGHLVAMEKVRGRKASLDALVAHYAEGGTDHPNNTVFIAHGDCLEDAEYVARKVRAIGAKRVEIHTVGPVIGAHSGPGTMTIFFTGAGR